MLSDNFEGPGLSPATWASNIHGQIVVDPLNASNRVLNFSATQGGGDLFSVEVPNAPTFYLSFDYLFLGTAPFGGGFIGVQDPGETWLAGDCNGCYPTPFDVLTGLSADTWHHIQIQYSPFGPGPTALKLEQFVGNPGNAYFDNLVLSDSGFGGDVPEPSTVVLLGAGIAAIVLRQRKVRNS